MSEARPDWLPRVASWFSPAYPVGAYAYSHGLEWAVECGRVRDRASLQNYICATLEKGGGWSDLVLAALTWRAARVGDFQRCADLADVARALRPSAELALETMQQGAAFVAATRAAWPGSPLDSAPSELLEDLAYPVAIGLACAGAAPLEPFLQLYAHAFVGNLVSAGIRLIPLGQTEGQKATAELMSVILSTARSAASASIEDIGSAAPAIEIASMRHETQYTRLFRS